MPSIVSVDIADDDDGIYGARYKFLFQFSPDDRRMVITHSDGSLCVVIAMFEPVHNGRLTVESIEQRNLVCLG